MNKKHLILWGGSWTALEQSLTPENIDSHAKVSFVFLKEALSEYFEITGIEEFNQIADIENHLRADTIGILSTFQAGFTQLRNKKPNIYKHVAPQLKNKMFSIIDATTPQRTVESKLFTVIPPGYNLKSKLQTIISPSDYHHMGWCAAPSYCYPEKQDKTFTIFVDHGHYAGPDHTTTIMQALQELQTQHDIRILIQTNKGVIDWPADQAWQSDTYERQNKVPWIEMMHHYRQADLFCLTHKESAGLSSIESAMCGAHLIIPQIKGDVFLNPGLLRDPIPYSTTNCDAQSIRACIETQIKNGIDKKKNHEAVKAQHSWANAAARIAKALNA